MEKSRSKYNMKWRKENQEYIACYLPKEFGEKFKKECVKRGISQAQAIQQIMKDYLNK